MIGDDVAEAVLAELAAQNWTLPFTPRKVEYSTPPDQLDLTALRVQVGDNEIETAWGSRNTLTYDVTVQIAVMKEVTNEADEVPALKKLAQEILEHFAGISVGYGRPVEPAYPTHRAPDLLREKKAYVGVISLIYRVHRGI